MNIDEKINYIDEIKELLVQITKEVEESLIGSVPLFKDMNFNNENWMGGDAFLLRRLLDTILDSKDKKYLINNEKDNTLVFISLSHIRDNDNADNYFDIIIREIDKYESFIMCNHYIIKIYKNRGRIKNFLCNGKDCTITEYIDLLIYIREYTELIKGNSIHDYR